MEKEKKYTPIIITFGIILLVVLVGVYYIGKSSNNQTQNNQIPTETSAQNPATQSPQTKTQNQTITNNNDFATDSENGLACQKIANEANKIRFTTPASNVMLVLKSHFSKTFNKCYYEIRITAEDGVYQNDIRVAPDDVSVAQCNSGILPAPQLYCMNNQNNKVITEQEFNQLVNTYFNN